MKILFQGICKNFQIKPLHHFFSDAFYYPQITPVSLIAWHKIKFTFSSQNLVYIYFNKNWRNKDFTAMTSTCFINSCSLFRSLFFFPCLKDCKSSYYCYLCILLMHRVFIHLRCGITQCWASEFNFQERIRQRI